MGYSQEFTQKMSEFHTMLFNQPDTQIILQEGPDDFCEHFPTDQPYHCKDCNVTERDRSYLALLHLDIGKSYAWTEIETAIINYMNHDDIPKLCATCPWLSYGVCEEGVKRMQSGLGLLRLDV